MADTTTKLGKPGKLPPITATGGTEGTPAKKKVVRKKKKPVTDAENTVDGEEKKPTPRRRKAAASSSSTAAAGGETTTPKKKKKIHAPKPTGEDEVDPSSARSGASQGEDVAGSKASLISKSTKDGTPRKKKVKKKVKKIPQAKAGEDFFDSTLAADLEDIKEDIVPTKVKEDDKDYDKKPYSTQSNVLPSQPTEKFYIETDGGFKRETKIKFAKRVAEEEKEKAVVQEVQQQNTITFALDTLKVFKIISLFCHGLLAGFSAWHIVISYILLNHGNVDFLEHYHPLAMPVQCLYFFLLAVCTVSACDRFDIANPKRGFLLRAITLQNGTISVLIYFAALILSLANSAIEDKINLYNIEPMLWNVTVVSTVNSDLDMWRDLNTARGSLSILGWFVIALAPVADRLTDNLKKADHIVSEAVELGKSSIA